MTQAVEKEGYVVRAVGHVRSGYAGPGDVRHVRRGWTEDMSRIVLSPGRGTKLSGLRGYSHIIVVFWIHRVREWRMPKDHNKPPWVKVYATRMPARPNPIGLSAVELVDFSTETGEIFVRGLDAVDGTPILDIKPYIPHFDSYPEATIPDWVAEHLESHHHGPGGHVHGHMHAHTKAKEH